MTEYGAQLLLRRICLSKNLRIAFYRELSRGACSTWRVHATDDMRQRRWSVQGPTLGLAAHTLAHRVGIALPCEAPPAEPAVRRF